MMTGINTNMAIVDGLTLNTNYEFQVKANNSAGHGQASNPQTFATSELLYFILVYLLPFSLLLFRPLTLEYSRIIKKTTFF